MSLDSGAGGLADLPKNVDELRLEVERLTRELDQATSERAQSAQYGLSLLEEKSGLAQKVEELETLYENAKHELEITQELPITLNYHQQQHNEILSVKCFQAVTALNNCFSTCSCILYKENYSRMGSMSPPLARVPYLNAR
uniref:Uncharacterized protein n=1 Tax=Glossina pallidipes TaxID=7398 RepID=A0A1A9Z9D8_GLOPL